MSKQKVIKLKEILKKEKLDAVLISSVSNISYLTGYANFSNTEREAYLLIGESFEYIITDGRYSEAVKKQIPHLTLFERSHKNPTEKLFKSLKNKIKVLGIEEDNLTVGEHKILLKHFKKLKHFSLKEKRSIKQNWEIDKIKKASEIADKAFSYILKKIKPGITEKELAFEIEFFIKKEGADISFKPIVAFGKNSSVPHHQTGDNVLDKKDGQIILIDMGAKFENYCSDMTRTIFFGNPSIKQQEIYNLVLSAQTKGVEFINQCIKNGKKIMAKDVDKIAREYIKSKGYPDIPHSLGHGIGLEVHEHPYLSTKSKEELKEGMVFSIEPGIYLPARLAEASAKRAGRQDIPDFGSPRSTHLAAKRTRVEAGGVRIEDLFILEKDMLRKITKSTNQIIKC